MADSRRKLTRLYRPPTSGLKPWLRASFGAIAAVLLTVTVTGSNAARVDQPRLEAGSLTGRLLVAAAKMPDPRFMYTVIYMVRHDADGAMGVVVNRPLGDVPFARLFERLGIEDDGVGGSIRVHKGGPVEETRGFVLHSADYVGDGTMVVDGEVALTAEADILSAIAAGTGPRLSLFLLGYAGWAPGQLEAEMAAGDWVTVPADEALVFDDDYDGKWQRAIARRGIDL
ncbi:MAG: YqgE/AlgH family protein [Alphaproteobacteria bacterium]